MRNNVASFWTADRTEVLRKLWASGASFTNIAAELGAGITRCAVGGKIFRLDLNRASPGHRVYHRRSPEQLAATKREKMNRRNERRRGQSTPSAKMTLTNLEALRCVEVESLGKTLLELGPNDCRYPFGDGPEYTFCGHPQFEGSSYCGAHFGLTARRGQT